MPLESHHVDGRQHPFGRWSFWAPALALLMALTAPIVRAQGEASISGKVTDATGSAIPHVSVKVTSEEKGSVRTTGTDESGNFNVPLLSVGEYRVTAQREGFATVVEEVTLVLGQRANLEFTLEVAGIHQAVQVEARPFAGDVSTNDVSGLVSEREVKDLPLNGRSYDQLLTLNPGVVNYTSQRSGGTGTSNSVVGNMFAVSGHRPQENLYLLNGVEFTSASEVNNTPGGTSGQLLGVDAVQEFALVKDTYGAEYGKRPGAQINIVTASGTNKFTATFTSSFATARSMRGTSSTLEKSPTSSATNSAGRWAARSRRTRHSSLPTMKVIGRRWGSAT